MPGLIRLLEHFPIWLNYFYTVMPGLGPGIHVFGAVKTWMAGPSPAMTTARST